MIPSNSTVTGWRLLKVLAKEAYVEQVGKVRVDEGRWETGRT